VIGAGHNGLTAAFYLAKAGLKPLVLERRPEVGGAATTEEIAPGYFCPALAHAIGPLRPSVVRDMQLERRGVAFVRPDPRLVAISPDGRPLVFSIDHARTAEAIRALSSKDANRYEDFCATMARLGTFLSGLLESTPPSLDAPGRGELWDLLKLGRRFRALGKTDGFRLLRWGPMAAADLVAEWFEADLLQGAVAARGISVRFWDFLFYASFGFVVTRSVAIAGVLLVFCYLIVPSVGAMLWASRIGSRLAIGWVMGVLVSMLGMYFSVQFDLPTGATIVCTFGLVLILMAVARPLVVRRA